MTHKSNHAERGYILVLTLLLVSIIVVSISQLVQRVSVTYFFDKTIVQREQAKELALSGIQLAISQLALKPEKKEEKKESKEKPLPEQIQLMLKLIPLLNVAQTISLKQEVDGQEGIIQFCISSEDGKIDLNALYDFDKNDFVDAVTTKKELKELFGLIKKFSTIDLYPFFESWIKKQKRPIEDVSELLAIKEFQQAFVGRLFYEPPAGKQKSTGIYLADIFTVSTGLKELNPVTLSDSMSALLGLTRADSRAVKIKELKELLKKMKSMPTSIQSLWDTYLKKLYGKDYKALPKSLAPLLSSGLSFSNFTVVSYGTVGSTTQRVVALLERRDKQSFLVRKLYWI